MPNQLHLKMLLQCASDQEDGATNWNKWRKDMNTQAIDLSGVDLSGITLHRYNLAGTNFSNSNLNKSILIESNFILGNFSNANLVDADLSMTQGGETIFRNANMFGAKLGIAILTKSDFQGANLKSSKCISAFLNGCNLINTNFENAVLLTANLSGSNLEGANLQKSLLAGANISNANLTKANISESNIFGLSAWNINTKELIQKDLVITNDKDNVRLTVDDIEVAQFIYLLSFNEKLSGVIDTITSKVVLVLGRFTEERKKVLDAIKIELRQHGYISVVFDFDKPLNRTLTETVGLIGRMSRFIVADLTDAKSLPQELSELIPSNPSLAIQPILLKGTVEYSMFEHWVNFPWVMPVYEYESESEVINNIKSGIIDPPEEYINNKK